MEKTKTHPKHPWLLVLAALLALNLLVGYQVYSKETARSGDAQAFEKVKVMMRVMHLIRQNYVDADNVKVGDLIDNAMRGMVGSLDPFSSFMTPEDYKDMVDTTEGHFGGLGIVVTIRDGMLTIVTPMEDSPGKKAGLRSGDLIVEVDGKSTRGQDLSESIKYMKGDPGTKVTITIMRKGEEKPRKVTIERAIIEVPTVKDAQVLGDGIGYIRITQFSEPTAEKLQESLEELSQQKITGLVIDVRNNPGGLLQSAVGVCSLFLKDDKLIVSTEGRRESQQQIFRTVKGSKYLDVPIAILINGGSASAAEILAGCLQDWGRALLVGEKSFGKGSVQNVIPLQDGSALRLTTAKYYTPSKRVIHENGIEPDIAVSIPEDDYERLAKEREEFLEGKRSQIPIDAQLLRALETLKSYTIYQNAIKARKLKLRSPAENASSPQSE